MTTSTLHDDPQATAEQDDPPQPARLPTGPRETSSERPRLAWTRHVRGTWYHFAYDARRGLPGNLAGYRWVPQMQEWLSMGMIALDGTEDPQLAGQVAARLDVGRRVFDPDGVLYEVTENGPSGLALSRLGHEGSSLGERIAYSWLWKHHGPLTPWRPVRPLLPPADEATAQADPLPRRVPGTNQPLTVPDILAELERAGWTHTYVGSGQHEVTRPDGETHTVVMAVEGGRAELTTARMRLRQLGLDRDLAQLDAEQAEDEQRSAADTEAGTDEAGQRPPLAPGEFREWMEGLDPMARSVVEALTALVVLAANSEQDPAQLLSLAQLREMVRNSFQAAQRVLDEPAEERG